MLLACKWTSTVLCTVGKTKREDVALALSTSQGSWGTRNKSTKSNDNELILCNNRRKVTEFTPLIR